MARKNHITNLTELLLQCMAQPDPMLSMLEWLCSEFMEAEVNTPATTVPVGRANGAVKPLK